MKKVLWLGVVLVSCAPVLRADAPAAAVAAPAPVMTAAPADDLSTFKTADDLRTHLEMLNASVEHATSRDEALIAAQNMVTGSQVFMTKYPKDPHFLEVKEMWAMMAGETASFHLPGAPSAAELDKAIDEMAENKSVPEAQAAKLRQVQIMMTIQQAMAGDTGAKKTTETLIGNFEKKFGPTYPGPNGTPMLLQLRGMELMAAKSSNPDWYLALGQKMAMNPDPKIAAMGKSAVADATKMKDLKTKPMDLKFTDVDGQPQDIAKLRGKVVLIDFWATWCGPCVAELPNVVAAYQKYHGQGFEVLGVSLDQDKNALQTFRKSHGMPWPQYFDGKGWGNDISHGFGINAIPDMWLVDKKGMLVTTSGEKDLDGQVAALLKKM